jgi:hypothetical protein
MQNRDAEEFPTAAAAELRDKYFAAAVTSITGLGSEVLDDAEDALQFGLAFCTLRAALTTSLLDRGWVEGAES